MVIPDNNNTNIVINSNKDKFSNINVSSKLVYSNKLKKLMHYNTFQMIKDEEFLSKVTYIDILNNQKVYNEVKRSK